MATFSLRTKALKPPFTLQQKIIRKMAFDRNPMLSVYADKVMVRNFVQERVGSEYLTTSFGVYSNLEFIDESIFPINYVVKANHCSGAISYVGNSLKEESNF
jgi:hypothetical protein